MEIKQKFTIPKPNFELDGSVMFLGNEEEIDRYTKEEDRILHDWQNLLLEIIDGKTKCISIDKTNTVCTLSRGIENKDTVRYSNFFKKKNGQLDAILHHEFSKEDLDVLIYTYLFAISEDKSIRVGDILLDSNKKERKLMKTFDELLEVAEKRYSRHGDIKSLLNAYRDFYSSGSDIAEELINNNIEDMNRDSMLTIYGVEGRDYFDNAIDLICIYDVLAKEYYHKFNGYLLNTRHAEYEEVIGDLGKGQMFYWMELTNSWRRKPNKEVSEEELGTGVHRIENESDLGKTSKAKKMLHDLKDKPSDFSQEKIQEKTLDK